MARAMLTELGEEADVCFDDPAHHRNSRREKPNKMLAHRIPRTKAL